MKKIYLKKDNTNKTKALSLLFFLFILFSLFSFSDTVSNSAFKTASVFQKTFNFSGEKTSNWIYSFIYRDELKKQKNLLIEENEKLISEIVFLRGLREENDRLRKALDFGIEKEFVLIDARINGKDVNEESFIINKGRKDGVSELMPVITENRFVVGRISEVFNEFSRFEMITHPETSFDAEIQGKDATGLVKGKEKLGLEMTLIPEEKKIQKGDIVLTSSFGGIFPQGLIVGIVRDVRVNDTDPFKEADINLVFNPRKLKNVFVIKEY